MNGPLPEDLVHEDRMIAGSAMLRRAIEDYFVARAKGRPHINKITGLFWSRPYQGGQKEQPAFIERNPPRVTRDPCFRCGTRADVGCSHRRVA